MSVPIHDILRSYWGHANFRPLQKEIILSVLAGNDTLALLPTGGGKSLCFQVPALAAEGVCIVISPLIALMRDQVEQLKKRKIPAVAIYSGMGKREIDMHLDSCVAGKIKFLYVSPERLGTELMIERTKRMQVCLFAIDEAHCISQWGYDFRPSYLQIAQFREIIPNVPVIALTATATEEVKKDIQEKLFFKANKQVFQQSFARANLSYSCFYEENKEKKLVDILQKVNGSAVVYARSRKKVKDIAELLQKNRISADFYHAGLTNATRNHKQEAWITNKLRVMVATNAFGMGIDKPDVRIVIHIDLPDSLEAYYQEAGRGGRDERKAYAVALYNKKDLEELEKRVLTAYPSIEIIKKVYQALANYYQIAVGSSQFVSYDLDLPVFQHTFSLEATSTYHALKKLEEQGFLQLNEAYYNPSRVIFMVDNTHLYTFLIANKNLEPIIKTLLRMYGGELFMNFTQIHEKAIAPNINIKPEDVEKQLEQLQTMGILVYEKQKEKPQLTFLTPRHDAEKLPIDAKGLENRKQRDLKKAAAVVEYVTHETRCRTLLLLEYFGEVSYKNCEVCDICLQKKKEKENIEDFHAFYKQPILTALTTDSLSLRELMTAVKPKQEDNLLYAVQKMVDIGEIKYLDNGKLIKK